MLAAGEQVAGDSGYVIAIVRLADGTARPLHPRRWTELGAIAWLRDGGGIVFHAVGSDSDFDLWRLTYPSGELRKITSDLSRYGRATVSVSDGGDRLLAVRSKGTISVWTAAAPVLAAPARVTDRASGKLDGSAGLAWASDASIVYVSFFNNSSSLWTVAAAGGEARPLTSPGYDDRFPRATRDGRYIVFASNRGGGSAIWRIDADGRGLRRLTTSGQDDQPDVAPDGRWVFYTSSDRGAHAIWKISIDGGPPVPVVRDAAWPRVSPDGRLLACAVDGPADRSQLAVFSVRAGHVIGRFELPRTGRMNTGLQWTPDGTAIVYRDFGEGLWIQPLAGGAPPRMDGVPPRKLYGFSWSPDGRRFAMSYGDELRDVVLIRHVG
jgi:Tol biopolymer transport system component